jgi:methylated-DNA-[protein]-cysteine S-methyltransferase
MNKYTNLKETEYLCPFGKIKIILKGGKISRVSLEEDKKIFKKIDKKVCKALDLYFKNKNDKLLKKFPLCWEDLKDEERKVLEYIRKNLNFSQTITYGEIAKIFKISPRKVGKIMKKNPFPLFVPCHRVIGKNGIGGFNYGIEWKKFLIEFEK